MCGGCGCKCKDAGDAENGDGSNKDLHPCKKCMLTPCVTHICLGVRRTDYLKHCNCYPPAIFIPAITIVQIVIFAVYAVELAGTSTPVTATTGYPRDSPLVYRPTRRYEAWRYLTYMFIHQGWEHLIGNMLLQLFVGVSLEMIHKWWRVMIVYLCGIIAGSLLHSMIEHNMALVGASAGAFALVGAHLAVVITNWKQMRVKCECKSKCLPSDFDRTLPTAPLRLVVVLPLVLHEIGRAIYKHVASPEDWKIAVGAHIGGILAGVLLGVPLLKNMVKLPWETTLGIITAVVFLLFVTAAVLFNGLYKGYPPTDWS
ncbi:rhomboid-related protein 2-like [Haliotis cracherodii]|uniref:rhomboid-related protein 2-like n=1 Tax=Haliotis cracherodii TaxID=6455 RepID=UPI0039ECABA4